MSSVLHVALRARYHAPLYRAFPLVRVPFNVGPGEYRPSGAARASQAAVWQRRQRARRIISQFWKWL